MNRREAVTRVAWMLGGVFSAPTLQAMTRWEQITTSGSPRSHMGSFLNETQHAIMARVADLIIPQTDTPGALDVGVPDFIEIMLRDCYKKPAQDLFLAGLGDLDQKGFLTLSPDQQMATLTKVEAEAQKNTNPSFWQLIKEQTLLGYFTSEGGIKASFDYQPIPGRFEAIKIKPGQKDFMYGNQA
ncbi:gluconate 2-dehydrogenase subunit 3 family protein [Spirosoma jeollabukense]